MNTRGGKIFLKVGLFTYLLARGVAPLVRILPVKVQLVLGRGGVGRKNWLEKGELGYGGL